MTKQNAFTREDLLRCSRGELFGPGNAQLPAPNMLMIDRIALISDHGGKYGKGEIVAGKYKGTKFNCTLTHLSLG